MVRRSRACNRDWQARPLIGPDTCNVRIIGGDPSVLSVIEHRGPHHGGQLPIPGVAIRDRSRTRRAPDDTLEFHSRNHMRILSRGRNPAVLFSCSQPPFSPFSLPLFLSFFFVFIHTPCSSLGFSMLNFYRAFPPAFPAREDRWHDLGLLCSRDRLSGKFDPRVPFFPSPAAPIFSCKFLTCSSHSLPVPARSVNYRA